MEYEKYLELFNDLEISSFGHRLTIEGTDYTLSHFRSELFNIVPDDTCPLSIELMMMERKNKDQYNAVSKRMFDAIKNSLKPAKPTTGLEGVEGLDNLTPVVCMESDDVYLINEAHDVVSEINFKAWLKTIDPELKKVVMGSPMQIAKFIFDPYDTTKIRRGSIDNGNQDMIFINNYNPPAWRSNNNEVPESNFLGIFLDHLFDGNKEQINYCKSWMAEAIYNRNETYLVLNGDKGVGKNTLYEIMRAVISPKYCVTAPKSLTNSQFNSALKDKRLILLDEYKVRRSEHMALKRIINKIQTIEMKGVDADREIETFNSFMIFHNDVSDMYLEKDDRRFSVMDITSKNLLELWDAETIQEYMIQLNDYRSDLTLAVGRELKEWRDNNEYDANKPFKGDKFHEIVEYHMPTWLQICVSMIENGEVRDGKISFKKEIEKRLSNEMLGSKKIQWRKSTLDKILREYKYKGAYSLGNLKKSESRGGSFDLQVNPTLLEMFDYDEPELLEYEDDIDFL